MKESEIQKKIIDELKKNGWIPLKVIICNLNGWPDISAFKDGKCLFLEVKIPGKKPRPLQKYRLKELSRNGFFTYCISSYKELPRIFQLMQFSK